MHDFVELTQGAWYQPHSLSVWEDNLKAATFDVGSIALLIQCPKRHESIGNCGCMEHFAEGECGLGAIVVHPND